MRLKTIGIIAGRFKPPHVGHYETILRIAKHNDETEVFVSPIEIDEITGKMSVKILQLYFKKDPTVHIHLAKASPVKAAYQFIDALGKKPNARSYELNIYALESDLNRFDNIDKFIGNIRIENVGKIRTRRSKQISGTMMRNALTSGSKEDFLSGLPEGIDGEFIWNIIHRTVNETGEFAVPADSFSQSDDPNTQPSPINVQLGGIPGQWTNSQPYSRWDMTTSPTAQAHGRNPIEPVKKKHVMSFNDYATGK